MNQLYYAVAILVTVTFSSLSAFGAEQSIKTPSEKEFCRLDRDSDRLIDFDEFAACEFYKLEHLRKLPDSDVVIKDGKGRQMTDEELKAHLFDKADKNKDRKIDRKEWEEFYNSIMNIH